MSSQFSCRGTKTPFPIMKFPSFSSFLLLSSSMVFPLHAAAPAPLVPVAARASSSIADYPEAKAIDAVVSDASRWVSKKDDAPSWLEVDLGASHKLAGVHLFSGYQSQDAIQNFTLQFWGEGKWVEIPSATITGNKSSALAIAFDQTVAVETTKLRLWISASHQGTARVKELVIWPASVGDLPALPALPASAHGAGGSTTQQAIVPIYLNQSGFNLGKPKRFTAPTVADGTAFSVQPANGGPAVFTGSVRGHIGDFSAFDPASEEEFVVAVGALNSVPFRIGANWLERVTYQNAVDFMVDSRHYVGNDRTPCRGSFGWRDDHHFGWELHTLVPQFLSNPSAYLRMPKQIRYEAPKDPKLWGALEPYRPDAPDIVKLIHWGADIIVTQKLRHEMLKSQLAYFLYAWPALEPYLPAQNYQAVRDFAFSVWADPSTDQKYPYDESPENNLLALKTKLGTTKGPLPPGFSLQPNLMMFQVATRDKRPDADLYLKAAFAQAKWLIAHLDWNDPLTTKGQRMSEFITVTGLSHFLSEFPDRAPKGLAEKLNDWAAVVVRRSENLWDFRKLDDKDGWTPMGKTPQMWNEPGNVIGLPAAILAAQPFITDSKTRDRLTQIVWSHFDNMFGRNPVGRHFSFDAPREIEGVEHGWFKFHAGGIGRLAEARFVIDGSPKNAHYPYHPELGDIGWTEGWVQFNADFNVSLAYLAWAESKIDLARSGDELVIRLTAPLNFDYQKVESATVNVTVANQTRELTLTEDSPNATTFTGRLKLPPGQAATVTHGFGYLGQRATLP